VLFLFEGHNFTRNLSASKPRGDRVINKALPNENRQIITTANVSSCVKEAFKDFLLVIVYNYPFYDSIPHLEALYKPAFPHLLFCGPPHNTTRPGIVMVDIVKGFLGYECLDKIIREYPGYEGYFYISDDVILKYWNFPEFDREKIWESSFLVSNPINEAPRTNWYWWNTQYGLNNCRRACENVAQMTLKERKLNGTRLLNNLLKNGNGKLRCFGSRSDVLYIPQRHAKAFAILSKTFYKHKVFLEIAVPTINRLLEQNENIARLPGHYLPGRLADPRASDSRFFWYLYFSHSEYRFIHPFKLHREGLDSKFNLVMFKFVFIEKIKTLTNCKPTFLQ